MRELERGRSLGAGLVFRGRGCYAAGDKLRGGCIFSQKHQLLACVHGKWKTKEQAKIFVKRLTWKYQLFPSEQTNTGGKNGKRVFFF